MKNRIKVTIGLVEIISHETKQTEFIELIAYPPIVTQDRETLLKELDKGHKIISGYINEYIN